LAGVSSPYDPRPYDPHANDPNAYDPSAYDPSAYDPQQSGQQPYQQGYPQQPYQQPYPSAGYPPAGYQPAGYQPAGYQQAGYQQWQPPTADQPRRPGLLVTAGVLWLLNGAFLLVFGLITAFADRLPGFEEAMLQSGRQITHEQLLSVGLGGAAFGAVLVGLAIVVLVTGATWARILIMAVAVVPTVFLVVLVVFPLITVAASVLQFLSPVNRYVQARRGRPAG
jgi:hypothetical protein